MQSCGCVDTSLSLKWDHSDHIGRNLAKKVQDSTTFVGLESVISRCISLPCDRDAHPSKHKLHLSKNLDLSGGKSFIHVYKWSIIQSRKLRIGSSQSLEAHPLQTDVQTDLAPHLSPYLVVKGNISCWLGHTT